MTLKETLSKHIAEAMKAKNEFRLNALKLIKAELMLNEKDAKPKPELDVVSAYKKKLAKSRELLMSRPEAVANLDKELLIIDEYLPKALSPAEIEALVNKHLPLKNFGQIMAAVKAEIPGPFDGKSVSELIKKKLGAG